MSNRRALVLPALVVSALVVQAGLASPAQAAGQRYASPTGSGTSCTSVAPCSLATAINNATSSTEVIVAAGTYNMGGTALSNSASAINVHGIFGQPRPVINTSADTGLELKGSSAKVADLTINHSGALFGLNVFTTGITVQRVEVHSIAPVACFLGYSGLARDSLCVTSAVNGIALDDTWGSQTSVTNGALSLRNITAVATGSTSYGIRAEAGDFANLDINARNVIASGTKADLRATRTATSSDSDIALTTSNYDATEGTGNGVTITTAGSGANQKTAPIFSDASYHQAPSSPTVDKGTLDSSVGPADLDGEPRQFGAAVDIGVDEFVPDTTAPDLAFDRTPKQKTHKHKAVFLFHVSEPSSVTCVVDKRPPVPCGSPFKVKFKKSGRHKISIVAVDVAGNVDQTPATFKWQIKKKKKTKKPHRHPHH